MNSTGQPIVSRKTYLLTFAGLLGLTMLTVLLGMIDMGRLSMVVAVTIAAAKATLIATFFMHALYETKLVRIFVAGGVIWFLILVSLTMMDYLTRIQVH